MLYFYTGQVLGSRIVEQVDKKTKKTLYFSEVSVLFRGFDMKGQAVMQMDSIRLGEEFNDLFNVNINKFATIPYRFLALPTGTYMFVADDMDILFTDKNPTEYHDPNQQGKRAS